jgi:hypothetical protein
MKKIIVIVALFFFVSTLKAQQQETPEAKVAHKIANKMTDSLGLTNQQRAKIFSINMDLSKKKKDARKKSTDRSIVGQELQQIEGTRNAIYKTVLTQEQYTLYLQKKQNLVNNN